MGRADKAQNGAEIAPEETPKLEPTAPLVEESAPTLTAEERAELVEALTVPLEKLKELPADKRVAVSEASAYARAHLPNPIVEPEGE